MSKFHRDPDPIDLPHAERALRGRCAACGESTGAIPDRWLTAKPPAGDEWRVPAGTGEDAELWKGTTLRQAGQNGAVDETQAFACKLCGTVVERRRRWKPIVRSWLYPILYISIFGLYAYLRDGDDSSVLWIFIVAFLVYALLGVFHTWRGSWTMTKRCPRCRSGDLIPLADLEARKTRCASCDKLQVEYVDAELDEVRW